MKSGIGRLEYLSVRDAFPHEAHDFTVWLEQNIDVLTELLDLPLFVTDREKTIGGLRADLICRDGQGNTVIIENQLGRSDHDHFGRLMTYLLNLHANTAIWITPSPRLDHITAFENANARSDMGLAFYLILLQVVCVDDSRPAPLFSVLVQPDSQPAPAKTPLNEIEAPDPAPAKVSVEAVQTTLPTVWCVYPLRDQRTYELFLNEQFIGLGFGDLGDLRKLEPTPEAFRAIWENMRIDLTKKQISTFYPMFYSLVHRVAMGDIVIYPPTWKERVIYVGEVTGPYQYGSRGLRGLHGYVNRRPVRWIASIARDSFSTAALKGISVNLAFFQVRNETFLAELAAKLAEMGVIR